MQSEEIHELGQQTAEKLRKNNFAANYFKNREEALAHILSLISPEATIGIGGSVTIDELKIIPVLEKAEHQIFNHNAPGLNKEEALEIRRSQLTCDVFLTGANAITKDGEIVNRDGVGNRVAAMLFGPKTVIIVAGVNKIVEDLKDAEGRIKVVAAPLNNKRLKSSNPCVKAGRCVDCQLPTRFCNITTVMHKKPALTNTHVVIIGEELGY